MIFPLFRELFVHLFFERTKIPVHCLGKCPNDRTKCGLPIAERNALRLRQRSASAVSIMQNYRFAVVFENSNKGITEKIQNAYLADAIPIYFGPPRKLLDETLNPKAYVHCDLPQNMSLRTIKRKICQSDSWQLVKNETCDDIFERHMFSEVSPYFQSCIDYIVSLLSDHEAYENMLSEPLAPVNENGDLTGTWNTTFLGETVRMAMVAIGYD